MVPRGEAARERESSFTKKRFSAILDAELAELRLSPGETRLVFDAIDTDKSGQVTPGEIRRYVDAHGGAQKKRKSLFSSFKSSVTEARESHDEMQAQRDTIDEYARNLRVNSRRSASGTFPGWTCSICRGTYLKCSSRA